MASFDDLTAPHYTWPLLDSTVRRMVNDQLSRSLSDRDASGIVGEFEEAFRQFVGAQYAVSFSSGTGALHCLAATQIPPGSRVIAPAYTFFATASPFAYEGIDVVFADCDTYGNVTADTIERAYTPDVSAVIITHMWGVPCEMREIVEFCHSKSLLLFEDCSHAHFGSIDGRRVGLHADAAVFSTNQKAITSGEGGILVTNSRRIHDDALLFGHYNKRCYQEVSDSHPGKALALTGYGLKYRMHTLSAALGLSQLAIADEIERRRRLNLSILKESIEPFGILRVIDRVDRGCLHGLYVAGMRFSPEHSRMSRAEFLVEFGRRGGAELDAPGSTKDVTAEPLFSSGSPSHPITRRFIHREPLPGVEQFASTFLKLPLWGYPGDEAFVESYAEGLASLSREAWV